MFSVKICGITGTADALAAAEAGADAVGLNCYAGSPRFCTLERAREIAQCLPARVRKVGVFVDATPQQIRAAMATIGLDVVQLHGDQQPEFLRELRPLPVIKAFRLSGDPAPIVEFLRACHRLQCMPRMALVDAHQPGQFGGTGATLDWHALAAGRRHLGGLPLVLAGGLNPSNVAQAIALVRPWAVDTASGVEESPGHKSVALVRAFVAAAHEALQRLN
ncbi:MAG: hypothetical protein AB7O59_11615 [Pirellulales bacterium]